MTKILFRSFLLGSAAVAALLQLAPPASAQTYLFDRLFGGGRPPAAAEPAYPVQPAPPPPPAPKVVGPQYYTYKADPLVSVDFSVLARSVKTVADPSVTNSVRPLADDVPDDALARARPISSQPASPDFSAAVAGLIDFQLLAEKQIAKALVDHYAEARDFIWVDDGQPNEKAKQALGVLADAAAEGLNPEDYAVAIPDGAADAQAASRFEMELSARLLRYIRDAQQGRVNPNRISGYHDFAEKPLDWSGLLAGLKSSGSVEDFLRGWHPANAKYAALRKELADLRASAENDIVIDPRTLIKPGQTNAELPKVLRVLLRDMGEAFRIEFGTLLEQHAEAQTYVDELMPAIKAAQKARGLTADGVIGPRTIAVLVGDSKSGRIDKVLVAMEQLRWLPSDFGQRYVFINAPAFEAEYFEGGERKLAMRTVVGTVSTQTFFFQDEIEYVEFNPYWGIPRSILVNKYLSKLYQNPDYLDAIGYEVTDGSGQRIPSSAIDWTRYGANPPFDVRQPPGPKNSLGAMKIMFPNKHAIYMHDTPEKHLFDRDSRALSNGCVRLQDPRAMAAAVLGWDRAQVDARIAGGQNNRQDLSVKVPVYVTYFTAWPDQTGQVGYVPDVYDRDRHILAAMQKVTDIRSPAS